MSTRTDIATEIARALTLLAGELDDLANNQAAPDVARALRDTATAIRYTARRTLDGAE